MARRGWAALVAAAILCVAGCGSGGSGQEHVARPVSVAGCWGAPEEYRSADFTAITLVMGTQARPSGVETVNGTLNFYAAGQNSLPFFGGEYQPATGKLMFEGETFEFSGLVTETRIDGVMYQTDDGTKVDVGFEKEGKGCQGN